MITLWVYKSQNHTDSNANILPLIQAKWLVGKQIDGVQAERVMKHFLKNKQKTIWTKFESSDTFKTKAVLFMV